MPTSKFGYVDLTNTSPNTGMVRADSVDACTASCHGVHEFDLTIIDATLPLVRQQEIVRQIITSQLSGALRAEPSAWREVLAAESVYGRYLDDVLPERSTP